jgi:CheY-like chemotaxis protein
MDGVETTERIRTLDTSAVFDPSWYREMPIIALSANVVSGARETFLAAGMNDFLSKPSEAEDLNAILLKWLPPGAFTVVKKTKPGEGEASCDALLKELKRISDMDLVAGLSHVGHNEAAYIQMLRQFCVEFDGYVAEIKTFLARENWKEYSIRLHAMKGVFANIGADAISRQAYQLEYAAKNDDYARCQGQTAAFTGAMSAFKEKLLATSLMDEGPPVEKHRVEAAELAETLDSLQNACRQGLSDQADSLGEALEAMSVNPETGAQLEELRKLVASLDYDAAIRKAGEIMRSLPE